MPFSNSQTLLTLTELQEYHSSGLVSSLCVDFETSFRVPMEILYDESRCKNYVNKVLNKRVIEKMAFCVNDGITLDANVILDQVGHIMIGAPEPLFKVAIDITFKYERDPNFYKIKKNGLLPWMPHRDSNQELKYMIIHSFEPTLDLVRTAILP